MIRLLFALSLFGFITPIFGQTCDTNFFPNGKQSFDTYHHVAGDISSWKHYNTHDPSVYKDGDWYYMYSTDASWGGLNENGALKRRSKDLVNWDYLGNAFSGTPQSAQDFFKIYNPSYTDVGVWAPFLFKNKDKYILYYSAPGGLDGQNLAYIGYSTSNSADGPWDDKGKITSSTPGDSINAIDPTVVYDSLTQKLWMAYGSWFTGIYAVELDTLTGGLKNTGDRGKRIANRATTGRGQEGPELVYRNGWYYLFLTYDPLGDIYNTRVGRSKTPNGPFYDINGVDMAAKADSYPMILGPYQFNNHSGWQGTGHCGVYNDNGKYFFFAQGRPSIEPGMMVLQTREISWIDGWPILSPEVYAGVPDCVIIQDSLVGSWEHMPLIYNNNVNTNYHSTSQSLVLNSDGTFNDNTSNTWTFDGDTLHLNWQDGVSQRLLTSWGWDWECSRRTIVYTGIGSDNNCIWGKKIDKTHIENYTSIVDGATYIIRNALSHLLMDVSPAANQTVIQNNDANTKSQLWKVKSAGDDYYYLLPQHVENNLTLEVNGGISSNGADLVVNEIDGKNRQKFKITYNNNGLFRMLSKVSSDNSCADVAGFSILDGGNIMQWEYLKGINQQWGFTRVDSILIDPISIDTFPEEAPVIPELTLVYEPFNYPIGTIKGQGTSGKGWGSSWSITGPEENVQISDGLNYLGLETTGNSLQITAQDGTPTEATRLLQSTWLDMAGDYWLSVLFEVENPSAINDSWQGISLDNTVEQAYIGKLWGTSFLGINDPEPYLNVPSDYEWSEGLAWLVIKIVMSGDSNVDTSYMWINPSANTEPISSTADIKANITLNSGFNAIRCHLGQSSSIVLKIDELRIAKSWQDLLSQGGTETTNVTVLTNDVKVYPNPFNTSATLGYRLTSNQEVQLSVYTIDGKVIENIYVGQQESGYHEVNLQTENLFSGVYFYKLLIGDKLSLGKLIKQ